MCIQAHRNKKCIHAQKAHTPIYCSLSCMHKIKHTCCMHRPDFQNSYSEMKTNIRL